MTELLETAYEPMPEESSAPPPDEPKQGERRRVKVRISLFYDGTGNNKKNTGHRLENSETFQQIEQKDKWHGSSYFNDFSNVARLDMQTDRSSAPGYDYYIKVYTEGIGTSDGKQDSTYGNASGKGHWFETDTGVVAKVEKGLRNALSEIDARIPHAHSVALELVTVDTFGFSRGATAARYAVYRVLNNEPQPYPKSAKAKLRWHLEMRGFEVGKIEIKAVGLFDTVSSFGVAYIDTSDVKALHLDAVKHAKAVLHLAAAEEYRFCFSLTNIDSAVASGVGHQIFLPGAHSDVGGGYPDGGSENKVIWHGKGTRSMYRFLREYGWAEVTEVMIPRRFSRERQEDYWPKLPGKEERALRKDYAHLWNTEQYVSLHRSGISNQYSFIPLQLMAKFAKEQELPVLPTLEKAYEPHALPAALRQRIEAYAERTKTTGASVAGDWQSNDPSLRQLRHRFLHFSGESSLGYNLRAAEFGDEVEPIRQVHSDLA